MKYRKSYKIRRKKSIFKNRFFWLTILSFIILIGIIYFFIFSSFFQIQKIEISGNEKIEKLDIERVVQDKIIYNFGIVKTKSIWLINLEKINKSLLENFSQILKIDLKKEFPNKLLINIEERKPIIIISAEKDEGVFYFFIDKNGVFFNSSPFLDDVSQQATKIKKLNFSSETKIGEKIMTEEEISKILEIKSKLIENLKIPIQEMVIVDEKRLNIKTLENWEIYFNLTEDLNWQITKLKVVLENKITPEKRKNLKYIDLRFEKIYISPEGLI